MDKPIAIEALIQEAKRIQEDALYSAKGHFVAARDWDRWHLWIGIPTSIVAAVAGVSALSKYEVLSAILALLVAITSALLTFLNPKDRAAQHLKAGNAYNTLQNDARIFYSIECQEDTAISDLTTTLKALNDRRNALNTESPQIPQRAFEAARKGIESGEATHKVDKPKD